MKKLLAISLLAISLVGCKEKEDDIHIEAVKIMAGMSYYLKDINYTIIDYSITSFDVNSDGIVIVTYMTDANGSPLPLSITDN